MFPEFVRAVLEVGSRAFVAENVPALLQSKFDDYLKSVVLEPLESSYRIRRHVLHADAFGVPQVRRRVVFVGFRHDDDAQRYVPASATHAPVDGRLPGLPRCLGAREALGLPDIGYDALAPTIRSALTGPRKTTSVISSASAAKKWAALRVWPNGVAPTRERARAFVAKNKHFRLSVPDCAVLQAFPDDWPFQGPTYMMLGQIGNAVPPPMGYAVATAVQRALRNASPTTTPSGSGNWSRRPWTVAARQRTCPRPRRPRP